MLPYSKVKVSVKRIQIDKQICVFNLGFLFVNSAALSYMATVPYQIYDEHTVHNRA